MGRHLLALVRLDASDEVLYERVVARQTWHEVKTMPRSQAFENFQRYREGFAGVIAEMREQAGIPILHFQTDRTSIEHIVDSILAEKVLKGALSGIQEVSNEAPL